MKYSILILLILVAPVSAEVISEFDFAIDQNDTVELVKITSYTGNPETAVLHSSPYNLILTETNNDTEQIYLPVVFTILDPLEKVYKIPLSVRRPYNPKWAALQIYHDNTSIFQLSLTELLCNHDNICNNYESVLTCSPDCPFGSKDNWCDHKPDLICDPDCLDRDPDCKSSTPQTIVALNEPQSQCNQDGICNIYENKQSCPADCQRPITTENIKLMMQERAIKKTQTNSAPIAIIILLTFALTVAVMLIRKKL
jgi:hypothetical protein